MGVYKLDLYAKTLYGEPLFTAFEAQVFARQTDHEAVEIRWTTPLQVTSGSRQWTRLRLVRNSYGLPDTESDGWVMLDAQAGAAGVPNVFLDSTVVANHLYYYAVFVACTPDTYSASTPYQVGDVVVLSNVSYECRANNVTGVTPGTNPSVWAASPVSTIWYRCGGTASLAVQNYQHGDLLYENIPRPYKSDIVEITSSTFPINEQLVRFCRIFGFHFDVMKTEHVQLARMQDVLRCTDRQLSLIAQQMGLLNQMPAIPELRRTFVRDAAVIQRSRGSIESTEALVTAMTGWDCEVSVGYNQMHDLDEAAWASPSYATWEPERVYPSTVGSDLYSDIVSWDGGLYRSAWSPYRYSAYLRYTGGDPVRTGTGTIIRDADMIAQPFPGYVRLSGTVGVGDTITWTFPCAETGTFDVFLIPITDPSGGIVTATVNGVASTIGQIDLYGESRQQLPVINLGKFAITPTGNTLKLTVVGKNAISHGYIVGCSAWSVLTANVNRGKMPGQPGSTAAWGSAITPGTLQDTTTERNPLTNGYGGWNLSLTGPDPDVINPLPVPGKTPQWWVSPQGSQVGTSSPGKGNALVYTVPTDTDPVTTGTRELVLCGPVVAPVWSADETYFTGQAVTFTRTGQSPPPLYVALTQSVGREPDSNPLKWQRQMLTPGVLPEPSLIPLDCLATPKLPVWVATRQYSKGDRVAWSGHLYEAAQPVYGWAPTGYSTDNPWWRWIGVDALSWTWSVYHKRSATSASGEVRPFIRWYNHAGKLGGTAGSGYSVPSVLDRFELESYTWAQNIATVPVGYVAPVAEQQGVTVPWSWYMGPWTSGRGVVRPTGWSVSTTLAKRAGRALVYSRQWLYGSLPANSTGEWVYATFMSTPSDPAGTMEHGIACRWASTGYWLASRDRLTHTTVTLSGSTVTAVTVDVVATWTPLVDGERMRVRNIYSGGVSTIYVAARANASAGWRDLATITDTRLQSQTGWGLLERLRT